MSFFQPKTAKSSPSNSSNSSNTPFFGVQAKLNIGKSNDKYEKEADAVADKVVQKKGLFGTEPFFAPAPTIQRMNERKETENEVQKSEETEQIQEKPLSSAITSGIQCSSGEDEVQKKCNDCEGERIVQPFRNNRSEFSIQNIQKKCAKCELGENLQKKGNSQKALANNNFESRLRSSKGKGSKMDANTSAEMESAFGNRFDDVRIHKGSEAIQMSSEIGAQAFTNGNDVYFNNGKYDPSSKEGKHLLAHELTHTIQQKGNNTVQRKEFGDSMTFDSWPGSNRVAFKGPFVYNEGAMSQELYGDPNIGIEFDSEMSDTPATSTMMDIFMNYDKNIIVNFRLLKEKWKPYFIDFSEPLGFDVLLSVQSQEDAAEYDDLDLLSAMVTYREIKTFNISTANLGYDIPFGFIQNEYLIRNPKETIGEVARPDGTPMDEAISVPLSDIGPAPDSLGLKDGIIKEMTIDELQALNANIEEVPEDQRSDTEQSIFDYFAGVGAGSTAGATQGLMATNSHLMKHGFAAAGEFSVGIISYPNSVPNMSLGGLANLRHAESPIAFGHTIAYVRQGGNITSIISFGPASLMKAGADAYGKNKGVPGMMINHLDPPKGPLMLPSTHGFPNTNAVSIEWPVSPERAASIETQLKNPQTIKNYLAYVEKMELDQGGKRVAENCVAWVFEVLEGKQGLDGNIGLQGETPVKSQGTASNKTGRETFRQSKMQEFIEAVEEHQRNPTKGKPAAHMNAATGEPVASKMPKSIKVMKWGGRLFAVGGVALSGYRIASAEPEQRGKVIAEEAGGFVGGFAGGAALGLLCGPGAPVCSVVTGIVGGVIGGVGGSYLGGFVYDLVDDGVEAIIEHARKEDPVGYQITRDAFLTNDPNAVMRFMNAFFMR